MDQLKCYDNGAKDTSEEANLLGEDEEYIDFEPYPSFLIDAKFNSITEGLSELIDNSIQATISNDKEGLERTVKLLFLDKFLIAMDNGCGMNKELLKVFLTYSMNPKARNELNISPSRNDTKNSEVLSKFGTGGERALFYLGNEFIISTKSKDSEHILDFELNENQLITNYENNYMNAKSSAYKSCVKKRKTVHDKIQIKSNNMKENQSEFFQAVQHFQETNSNHFTVFVIALRDTIIEELYSNQGILKLKDELSDAHFFQLKKREFRIENFHNSFPNVKDLKRQGMMNTEAFDVENENFRDINLEFESLNSSIPFSPSKETLPTQTCRLWKTITSAKDIFMCRIPIEIPITNSSKSDNRNNSTSQIVTTPASKTLQMKVALCYMPFINGKESKTIDCSFYWQTHNLRSCQLKSFPFYPKDKSKKRSIKQSQMTENVLYNLAVNRITCLGFVNYDFPLNPEKTTLYFEHESIEEKLDNVDINKIEQFWEGDVDIKKAFSNFLTESSNLFDQEIVLRKRILSSSQSYPRNLDSNFYFTELNYRNGEIIITSEQLIVIKDNTIDRFVKLIDFEVSNTEIFDETPEYMGSTFTLRCQLLPDDFYGQNKFYSCNIDSVDFTNKENFDEKIVNTKITYFRQYNKIDFVTVTLISPNESSDQLELSPKLKVISDNQQTKTVVESDNSYDIIGIQITFENLEKKTWYEDHSTNYKNPIPLSVDISIDKLPSENIDENSKTNKKKNISILKTTKITHTDFRDLKDISSSSKIMRLANLEDCYFTINKKFKDVGEYIISVAVKNSLNIELFQHNFYIYVHGVNVDKLEFFNKIFNVRLDTPKIDPIRVQLTDACYSPILIEKRLFLKIIDKDFELLKVIKEEEEDRIVENINIVNGEANDDPGMKIYRFCDEQDHENLWIKWKYNIFNKKLSTQPLEKDIKFEMTINDDSKERISNQRVLYKTIPFRIFGAIPSRFKISIQENNLILTTLGQLIPTFQLDCYDCYDNHVTPMIHENWEIKVELKNNQLPVDQNNQLPVDQNNELPSLTIREELMKLISTELNQISHEGMLIFANKIINCKYEGGRLGSKGVTIELLLRIIDLPNFIPFELTFFVRIDPDKEMIGRIEVTYGTENQIFEHSKSNLQFKTNDIIGNIKLRVFNKRNEVIEIDEDMKVTCNWGTYAYESHQFSDISLLEENYLNTFKFEVSIYCDLYCNEFKFSFDILITPIVPVMWYVSLFDLSLTIRNKESWGEVFKNGFKIKSNENSDYLNSKNYDAVKPQLFAYYSVNKVIKKLDIPLKYSVQFNRFEINMDEFVSFSKFLAYALADCQSITFQIITDQIVIPSLEFQIEPSCELSKPLRIFLEAKKFNLSCTTDAEIIVPRWTIIQDVFIIVKDFYDDIVKVNSTKFKDTEYSIIKDSVTIKTYKQSKISVPLKYDDIDFSTVIDGTVGTIDISYIISGTYLNQQSNSQVNMSNAVLKVRIKPNNIPTNFIFWEDSSMSKQDINIEMIRRSGVHNEQMETITFKAKHSITCDDKLLPCFYVEVQTEDGKSINKNELRDLVWTRMYFFPRDYSSSNRYKNSLSEITFDSLYELSYIDSSTTKVLIVFLPKEIKKNLGPGRLDLKCTIRDLKRNISIPICRKQLSFELSMIVKAGNCVNLLTGNNSGVFLKNLTEISNAVLECTTLCFLLYDQFKNKITEDDGNIRISCSLIDSSNGELSEDLALIDRTADGVIQSKYDWLIAGHCFDKTIQIESLQTNNQFEKDKQYNLKFSVSTASDSTAITFLSSAFKYLTIESMQTTILKHRSKIEEYQRILASYGEKEKKITQAKEMLKEKQKQYETLLNDFSFKFYTESMTKYFVEDNEPTIATISQIDIYKSHISKASSLQMEEETYTLTTSLENHRMVVQNFFQDQNITTFTPKFVYELIFVRPEFTKYKKILSYVVASITSCILLDHDVNRDLKVAFSNADIDTLHLDAPESSYHQDNLQINSEGRCLKIINDIQTITIANTFCYADEYKSALKQKINKIVSNDLIVTSMEDAISVRQYLYEQNKNSLPNIYIISDEGNVNSIFTRIGKSTRLTNISSHCVLGIQKLSNCLYIEICKKMVVIKNTTDDIESSLETYIAEMKNSVDSNGCEEFLNEAIASLNDAIEKETSKIVAITPTSSPSKKRSINEII